MDIQGTSVAVVSSPQGDYISLTDMLRAKDGDFFISDWLRNRNTVEFLGIWESIYNPAFNYGEFATIKSQAGLNSYKISVKEWVGKTGAIGLKATAAPKSATDFAFLVHGFHLPNGAPRLSTIAACILPPTPPPCSKALTTNKRRRSRCLRRMPSSWRGRGRARRGC